MAVVETLQVRFQADMGDLGKQLATLGTQINGLAQTMDVNRGRLGVCAAAMIESVGNGLRLNAGVSTAPQQSGNLLSSRFAQALLNGQAQASGAAKQLSAAARFSDSGALSAARSAGAALGQGFANGISSKYSTVMRAANRIANAAASRIRSALKIHSPSRVSFELGGYFTEGFADGIYASLNRAQRSVSTLSDTAQGALSLAAKPIAAENSGLREMVETAVGTALGGTSIVIPLYVDGMKLGEASIAGINRVTRSAGRVLLEI